MLASALTEFDYGRLSALAHAVLRGARPERAKFLHVRLRSIVVLDDTGPDVSKATLGSTVAFRELHSGASFEYRLALPGEADIGQGAVSVLTPLGAALLGRGEGETFGYECPAGVVDVRIERVSRDG